MSLHDQFLATLESVANVSLVSKLRDPRLNIPDEDRLNIFIPVVRLLGGQVVGWLGARGRRLSLSLSSTT